ncbi:hypothetical protein [Pedobacter sp. MR22-3]|uniref:hypothetical protein n=1 Tax=Pedobacter sp. MR22-3 TaxID=2994552 RepID=UPI002247EAEC|nr:hypothetical protein [Pedobacter sp. MR22-3]MCX2584335.1 hypothetical protein [Pedobacter sp. MR22-3]
MNKLLKPITFGAIAIALGGTLFLTESAFTAPKTVTLKYRYNLNTATGISTASNWTDVSDQPNPSGCGGEEIPCLVQFDSSEYSSITAFLSANPTIPDMEESERVVSHKDEQ